MTKHLISVSMLCMLLVPGAIYASGSPDVNSIQITQQTGSCKGVVKDATGELIIGASVMVKGTTIGTITDIDGNFTLSGVNRGSTLVISFVGYKNQEVVWNGTSTPLVITLEEDTNALDELVVVGFGSQKKVDLTGAVSQVNMEDALGDRPLINAGAALQGAMPGLMVSGASGPGQTKSFNIRGDLSINGGSPLILIDNVEGDINALNPDDIESVSVLKDAASSAIYGARAAGGVILITTKHPKKDTKFQLNYGFNLGWENSINHPEQASLDQYIAAYEEANYSSSYWAGDGTINRWKELLGQYRSGTLSGVLENGIYQDADGSVYYLKEGDVLGNALETGFLNNHNISISGGTDKLRFRVSGNYSNEDGPLYTNKDNYSRKALNAYVSADINKWFTQEVNMFYTDTKRTAASNLIRDPYAVRLINWYPEGNIPGSVLGTEDDYMVDSPRNALIMAPTSNTNTSIPRIQLKSIIKPMEGWTITGEYTYNQNNYKYKNYTGILEYATVQRAVRTSPATITDDTYTINTNTTKYNALNLYTNFDKKFGNHAVGAMLGFNQESYDYSYVNTSILGQAVPTVPSFGGGTGIKNIADGYTQYTIRGGFGRLTYNYNDKYLLTVNARYDGSSKFPKANRYGFFPSVSAGWRVENEPFMAWSRDWLSQFKIRGSYGSIGNQNISPYGFVPSMSIGESSTWLDGGNKVTIITTPGLVRANYTWETVKTLDFGFDLNAFNNRFQMVFDWYQRNTSGMLSDGVELPSTVGASAPLQNVANMKTNGWEIAVTWQDKIGDFGYRVTMNLYDHLSEITKYNNESGNLDYYYVGRKLGEIWGYEADGFYDINDFDLDKARQNVWVLKEGVPTLNGYTARPGDLKFKDLNNDGTISPGANTTEDSGDRKIIGNTTSRYLFGATLGVNYKGFDLSVMLQGVGKRDYILSGSSIYPFGGAGNDGVFWPIYSNQTDYWTAKSYDPESADYMVANNPNAKLFRIYNQEQNVGSNARTSTKFMQSAAYMRIKNVTLSYNFSNKLLKPLKAVNALKLYLSVENLGTFTSLPKGYDPESLSWSYPFYRTWSFGANLSF